MLSGCAEASRHAALPGSGDFGTFDLACLLDSIRDLVVIIDSNAEIRAVNAAAHTLFGIPPDRMVGRAFLDFIHAAEHMTVSKALDALLNGAEAAPPLRLRIAGRKRRPLAVAIHRFKPESEVLYVLVGREEAQAKESVDIVMANWHGRQLGQWRYDLRTKVLSWCDVVGHYTGNGTNQRVMDDLGAPDIHPDDRDPVRAVYLKAISDKEPFFCRYRMRCQDGEYRLFESYGVVETDECGEVAALVGVSFDISKASEAASALYQSVGQLEAIFAEMSDFIIRCHPDGTMLYVSPSVSRVLGYRPEELTQTKARDLLHPDDFAQSLQITRSLHEVGQPVCFQNRMLHRKGHWVWIESTVRALQMAADGNPAEFIVVSRDVTERKRAEEELAAAYARAEAASATKSRFLANMSHELRTPLNAIIGFSDIIRRELFGPVGAERYKEYAQLIQESGGHLLDLINDILDMSKIEAGKFDLRLEHLELDDLIRSCLKLLEPRAQQAKLVLAAELAEEKTQIQADRRAIKQILLNLLTNAIKFTPPGGVVTASLQPMSDGVALQVRDTGVGIAEKDLARVTLPFEQVTHDPLLAQAGSGLGLALVQSLVGLHSGTLKIDSAPGEGTLVTVFLPADPRSRCAA